MEQQSDQENHDTTFYGYDGVGIVPLDPEPAEPMSLKRLIFKDWFELAAMLAICAAIYLPIWLLGATHGDQLPILRELCWLLKFLIIFPAAYAVGVSLRCVAQTLFRLGARLYRLVAHLFHG
jgi:hypothetical protein